MENSERDFGARVCFIIPSNWNYEINIFFFPGHMMQLVES